MWNDLVKHYTLKALSAAVAPPSQGIVSGTGLDGADLAYFNLINECFMSTENKALGA